MTRQCVFLSLRCAAFVAVAIALSLFGPGRLSAAANPHAADGLVHTRTSDVTINLRDFGAVGDGINDDGPALQLALNALEEQGGGTLYVPPGHYAIITPVSRNFGTPGCSITIQGEPSSTPIDVAGNGRGLDLQSELIIKVGETNLALTLSGLDTLYVRDLAFVGVQEVINDARVVLEVDDVRSANIQHCEFYGLASLVWGGSIVAAFRSGLHIDQVAFLGCTTTSGYGTSVVQNYTWKEISVTNSKFIDYGTRPGFWGKTPLAPPFSWINVGDAAPLRPDSLERAASIEHVFLDEGGFIGISAWPARFSSTSAPLDLHISRLRMNVSNLNSTGIFAAAVNKVSIDQSYFGWSHLAGSAISLSGVNSAILDRVVCDAAANTIHADSLTGRLVVINSTYQTLDSSAAYTRAFTTDDPMDDPMQYVLQQYSDQLRRAADLPGVFYWSNRLERCEQNATCQNDLRVALSSYLALGPSEQFSISGSALDEDGAPLSGASVTLTGFGITVQTDEQGSYSFGPLPTAGVYTLIAAKRHYQFAAQSVVTPASDQITDFHGILDRFTISGRITNQYGTPVNNAHVSLSGSQMSSTDTDAQGNYWFTNVPAGGSYTVTASRQNYDFGGTSRSIDDLSANQQITFQGRLVDYTISARATTSAGLPISGATVALSGSSNGTATTDINGNCTFRVRAEGNYILQISRPNYTFNDSSESIENLSRDESVNFTGVLRNYLISGRIIANDGSSLAGVSLHLTGSLNRSAVTDTTGTYSFSVPAEGSYIVTPSKRFFEFSPAALSFANIMGNVTGNFTQLPHDVVQFNNLNFTASEDVGAVEITVTRSGDTSRNGSVDYEMSDGTANQTSDYTLTAGRLQFAPGETIKSFSVLITADAFVEQSQETINLRLTGPSGFLLGSRNTATITILDRNQSPPSTNPIEDARTLVTNQYADFLGRVPDAGGLDYWTAQITACGNDQICILSRRVGVSAAFFVESEFQERGGFVYRVIKSIAGTRPDYYQFIEETGHLSSYDSSNAKESYAEEFVASPEFIALFPESLTKPEFIDLLISKVRQNTDVDLSTERDTLLADYSANDNRGRILRMVADYPQLQQAEYNQAFVLMQYFGYLRRNPDQGGYDFWLNVLNNRQPGNFRGMVCAFLTSREFQERFSPIVPRTNQDCAAVH